MLNASFPSFALLAMIAIASPSLWSATSTAAATAHFVKTDATTQGNWRGVYGTDGSNVIDNSASYPSYAVATPAGETSKTWAGSTNDPRALQKLTNATERIAAAWLSNSNFSLDLNLVDGNSHQVALYCLDWNSLGRRETIEILDATSGTILDSRSVASFAQTPRYLIWTLSGHVSIKVTRTGGSNAALSGIFFDAPPAGPVGVGVNPASASLSAGQSAQFNAVVSGVSNESVTWSINPAIGTVANGVYTAPAVINSLQAVTLTATSIADSSKTASATIILTPVNVTLSPGATSLTGGQSATFIPTVNGSSNTSLTWSLIPALGTIANGFYKRRPLSQANRP